MNREDILAKFNRYEMFLKADILEALATKARVDGAAVQPESPVGTVSSWARVHAHGDLQSAPLRVNPPGQFSDFSRGGRRVAQNAGHA